MIRMGMTTRRIKDLGDGLYWAASNPKSGCTGYGATEDMAIQDLLKLEHDNLRQADDHLEWGPTGRGKPWLFILGAIIVAILIWSWL